jgi:hypothetical protein
MTDLEKFRDFMFNEYNIINPLLTFDGDYILGDCDFKNTEYDKNKDILYLNSKTDDKGNNMYEELINRRAYFNFNDSRFDAFKRKYFYPLVVNRMNKDGKGRHLEFSYALTIMNMMENKPLLVEHIDETKMASICLDYYRNVKKNVNLILNEKTDPEVRKSIIESFEKDKKPTDKETLECYAKTISNLIYMYKCFNDAVEHPIIFSDKEFTNCYDPDKFILMYCKMILDNQGHTIKKDSRLDSSFVIVNQVLTTLKELNINSYNPTIKLYDKNTKKIAIYSFKDMLKEYRKLSTRYSDTIKARQMQFDQIEKMNLFHDNDAFIKFTELFDDEDQRIINTEFDILAKGEGDTHISSSRSTNNKSNNKAEELTEDEIIYRRYIFENTNYVCQIVGKDKFNGYIGYIYENGLVIFERFYEDNGKPTKQNATYIMNYKNFVEFIQLTKVEILECIKEGRNDIKRLYHTDNWANNLSTYISSIEKDMDSIMFANTISKDNIKVRK